MIAAVDRALGRGRRRVKLHLTGDGGTLEGILDGRVDGWFVVLAPKLHTAPGAPPMELANTIEVDPRRVMFVERLT